MKRSLLFVILAAVLLAGCAREGGASSNQPTAPVATTLPAPATQADPPTAATTETPEVTAESTPQPSPSPDHSPTPTEAASPTLAAPRAADIDPGSYQLEPVASGFVQPLLLTHNGVASSDRIYVVEQRGVIYTLVAGSVLPAPFLDIQDIVNSQAYERGLLDLAFHPDFEKNGQFFVNYTNQSGDTVVARYAVGADADAADPASGQILLQVSQPYPNHNGGHLAFGPDGHLYVALGDGGSAGDPQGHAQNLGTLLGALLRLDVGDWQADNYTVPADNPFVDQAGARNEIWAYGLRNPWRFSFDRLTGDLYTGDVGQSEYEEINFQPADSPGGENYGWNYMEGTARFRGEPPAGLALTAPIAEYARARPHCAVTGGYVYRGSRLPELNGVYLYGDYCSGQMWALMPEDGDWVSVQFMETGRGISSFGEDAEGELYVVDHNGGSVYRLTAR
jgi:glucose/arabinose dehydrogenase